MEAYKLCLSLADAAPNLAAPASPVPLEALVALCVRGLDDESPAARLAAAAATGAALSAGVEGSAAENERLGVIAARDQVREAFEWKGYLSYNGGMGMYTVVGGEVDRVFCLGRLGRSGGYCFVAVRAYPGVA